MVVCYQTFYVIIQWEWASFRQTAAIDISDSLQMWTPNSTEKLSVLYNVTHT